MTSDGPAVARATPKGTAIIRAMMAAAMMVGAMMIGSIALAAKAEAATVTYNFTQGGYDPFPNKAVVAGSFSGTPDGSGNFGLSNLTAFSYTLSIGTTVLYTTNDLSTLVLFSYEPSNSSSFDVHQHDGDTSLCIGAAAAFGLCGASGGFLGDIDGGPGNIYFGWVTADAAQVTLVPAPTTPIAPTLPLFATSLAALGIAGWRRRRSGRSSESQHGERHADMQKGRE